MRQGQALLERRRDMKIREISTVMQFSDTNRLLMVVVMMMEDGEAR